VVFACSFAGLWVCMQVQTSSEYRETRGRLRAEDDRGTRVFSR